MPAGLQVVNWYKQSLTGSAFEALAPGTGDSATFFNVPQGSAAYLGEIWGVNDASPCEISLTASRFHDQVYGIRCNIPDGDLVAPTDRSSLISPSGLDQPVFPSDVLSVQVNGVASDNVNVTLVMHYDDIPGISANLATYDAVKGQMKNLVGIRCTVVAGAGNWGASVALNATDNRLHANTWYAVLGWTTTTPCAAIGLSGIDTGNLRVGGPALAQPEHDAYLFCDLARQYGQALIPVINSNNAGSTFLQGAHPTTGSKLVDVLLAELRSAPF